MKIFKRGIGNALSSAAFSQPAAGEHPVRIASRAEVVAPVPDVHHTLKVLFRALAGARLAKRSSKQFEAMSHAAVPAKTSSAFVEP